ncbi:MAG: DUF3467 domain-containing protein [Gemmataceae bacterium]|nr:DUF3467 domain-containing protein [Gemmataceae bacterium]MDW8266302.1 DUF3467 domain-containing protein [Gemmataceae bacterium]
MPDPKPLLETPTPPVTPPAPPPPPPGQFNVDASQLSTVYANFCRVTGTPEELILDFGLNTQISPTPTETIKLTHRLVTNYYTAKRLLGALSLAIQQHEQVYGILETDINKRVRSGLRLGPGSGFGT